MISLHLPSFQYRIKKEEGKLWIFDIIRKKYVALIPEEWVRQHFLHYMVNNLAYPKSLIRVEGGLEFNRLQKRSDIVVYDREGKPWLIVECKAPDVPVSSETVFQAATYNATLRAKYIVVTNGIVQLQAETNWDTNETRWLDEMPAYS